VGLDGRFVDFPAAARPLAGRRTFDAATDLLDALLEATYATRGDGRRRDALVRANQRLALLRLLCGARATAGTWSLADAAYTGALDGWGRRRMGASARFQRSALSVANPNHGYLHRIGIHVVQTT
jgi:hypothetical protein